MAQPYTCLICGKDDLDGVRGAKGHIKFSGGDHGDRMELPDNWRDSIEETSGENDDDGSEDAETSTPEDEGDQSPSESKERRESPSDGSDGKGRIRRILTTPLDELLKGGA